MYGWIVGMYEHAGDVAADNEAPVMYHRILCSPQYDDEYYFAIITMCLLTLNLFYSL